MVRKRNQYPPSTLGIAQQGWNVYLRGKLIGTVYHETGYTADEVRRYLIKHDEYDPDIKVRRGKYRRAGKSNPLGSPHDIPTRWTPATVKRLRGGKVQIRIGGGK